MNEQHDRPDAGDDDLIAAAGRLTTAISPERDLWPGIEREIAGRQRSRWTPLLAQAAGVVLLVGASSGITYLSIKDQQAPVQQVATELLFERAAFGSNYALGTDYREAHGDLAARLDDELERLSPEARADVETNLALIRAAIADISKALANEPDNALLQQLLLKTYRDELALMQNIGALTQHVMSRQDI